MSTFNAPSAQLGFDVLLQSADCDGLEHPRLRDLRIFPSRFAACCGIDNKADADGPNLRLALFAKALKRTGKSRPCCDGSAA